MVLKLTFQSTPGLEQYAIKKFAEALEVVPRTIAENAGTKVWICYYHNIDVCRESASFT